MKKRFRPGMLSGCAFLGLVTLLMSGCATTRPPRNVDNLCEIFRENKAWYRAAKASYEQWGVPISVQSALVYQESGFHAKAKPPRTKFLWIFPGSRPSSAYGYAQSKDETWDEYQKSTGRGGADRDEFEDAVDFVGWYCNLSNKRCGIDKHDAYRLYLAYHEGHGGYNRKTYANKGWLLKVAQKVRARAKRYQSQLASCEKEFQKKRHWYFLWLF